ncbi:MAG: transcriptional regulator [Chloroflexota bacterium]|nr:MAG: transcriptional regulator [Chloroflexota bacterium]
MPPPSNIREHILRLFETLPLKQRRLARFFLDNEDMVAFASASEVAERAEASAATVVRFCRALGFEGYTDLQATIRTQFPRYRTAVQKLTDRLANGSQIENLPTQVVQVYSQNIEQTMSQVSHTDLTAAAAAIIQAGQIRIFAGGLSAAAAVLAEHALMVLGFSARACLNGGSAQALEISQLTSRDLVMVISIWRYLYESVLVAQAARELGCTCIALTDSPVAPIAKLADYTFVAATEGVAHSRSLAGIFSLIDLLSAAIATQRPQESLAALQRIDALYRQNGTLWSE